MCTTHNTNWIMIIEEVSKDLYAVYIRSSYNIFFIPIQYIHAIWTKTTAMLKCSFSCVVVFLNSPHTVETRWKHIYCELIKANENGRFFSSFEYKAKTKFDTLKLIFGILCSYRMIGFYYLIHFKLKISFIGSIYI